jgi:hypothetical protein
MISESVYWFYRDAIQRYDDTASVELEQLRSQSFETSISDCQTVKLLQERGTYSAIIIGSGGSGKTALLASLFNDVLTDDRIMLYNYPPEIIGKYPAHISRRMMTFENWSKVVGFPGIIVFDDSVLSSGSRSYSSRDNKDNQANMTIARHHDHKVIWTVQNTSLLDKLAFQSLDTVLFHKWMSLDSLWTEREEIIEAQRVANELIELGSSVADPKSLVYCSTTKELLQFDLPVWWNETISKPFKRCYVESGQIRRIEN